MFRLTELTERQELSGQMKGMKSSKKGALGGWRMQLGLRPGGGRQQGSHQEQRGPAAGVGARRVMGSSGAVPVSPSSSPAASTDTVASMSATTLTTLHSATFRSTVTQQGQDY